MIFYTPFWSLTLLFLGLVLLLTFIFNGYGGQPGNLYLARIEFKALFSTEIALPSDIPDSVNFGLFGTCAEWRDCEDSVVICAPVGFNFDYSSRLSILSTVQDEVFSPELYHILFPIQMLVISALTTCLLFMFFQFLRMLISYLNYYFDKLCDDASECENGEISATSTYVEPPVDQSVSLCIGVSFLFGTLVLAILFFQSLLCNYLEKHMKHAVASIIDSATDSNMVGIVIVSGASVFLYITAVLLICMGGAFRF